MLGSRLAHFRITAKLGHGGMGEVYQAEDTRLGREVAIKVLPEAFVADPERLARFEREARVLASLSHPNIAGIHEVGEEGGTHFLVMELATGETLAQRIDRGPIAIQEVLSIALQIAAALEAAHERGIVHRDLKPANVMVDRDGGVTVLDFGLAKAFAGDGGEVRSRELTQSPTLTARMTQAGIILGTAGYMSPEQARGQEADSRSDIWSFGVILWEMLSGRSLFREETVSDTLAAVLRGEIDLQALPDDVPRRARWLVDRCLERDPKRRLRHVGEARIALEDLVAGERDDEESRAEPPAAKMVPLWRRWLPVALGGALLALAAVLAVSTSGSTEKVSAPRLRRFSVSMPSLSLLRGDGSTHLALSPDGQSLVTRGLGGADELFYLRRFDAPDAVALEPIEGAYHVFFSPDGRWLGFSFSRSIWKLNLAAGGVTPVVELGELASSTTWSRDGHLYYATQAGELWRVRETGGGEPERVDGPDPAAGELRLRQPFALPSGRGLLLHVERRGSPLPSIQALDTTAGKRRDLGIQGVSPIYSPTGHLVFGQGDRALVVPFDEHSLQVTGSPTALVADIWITRGAMQLAVSDDGTMAYLTAGALGTAEPVLVSRRGEVRSLVPDLSELRGSSDPRFSPDGQRVVFQEDSAVSILDLRANTVSRLSDDGFYPQWSPDGESIVHGVTEVPSYDLVRRFADLRSGADVLMDEDNALRPAEWSEHGFIYREEIPGKGMDLKLLPPDLAGEPVSLLADEADELCPTISPDGRWLAFQSNRSGRDEVYVTTFPQSHGHVQVSTHGGRGPAWSPDGEEVFYFAGDTLTAARLVFDPRPRVVSRTPLFSGPYHQYRWYRQYDVHPDGEHFLMIAIPQGDGLVEVVLDWVAELGARGAAD